MISILTHYWEKGTGLISFSWGGTLGIATLLKNQHEFLGWIQVDGTPNPRDLYLEYIANFQQAAAEQISLGNSIPFWKSVNDLLLDVNIEFNRDDIARLNGKAFDAEDAFNRDNLINKPSGGRGDIAFNYNLVTFYWNLLNTQSIVDPPHSRNIIIHR